MQLRFLGTRGNIEPHSRSHNMHSSLLVTYYGRSVMVDCGADWAGYLDDIRPGAVVLTHAHPDHAWGLKQGAPCPVYATPETFARMRSFDIPERHTAAPRRPVEIHGMRFEAFPVEHSTRAPAVGYRITAGRKTVFYVPDVAYIHDRGDALSDIDIYIGDGATLTRSMVRKRDGVLIGHAPVQTQLTWCRKEGVPRAVITHCGSEIVRRDDDEIAGRLADLARDRGLRAEIAYDGMDIVLR